MLIDIHCHANLYLNLEEIIQDANENGVHKIICVGMSALGLETVLNICRNSPSLYPALGIHPEEVKMNPNIEANIDEIVEFIISHESEICVIGEIGLDHHFVKNEELYPLQMKIFKKMLEIAQKLELPVNLHTKGAEKEVFELLPSYKIPNVNVHWYSGPEKYLYQGIDRGYFFSITPAISYSPAVKNTVKIVEPKKLLLESDGPVKYSGSIGVPSMVHEVLNTISNIKKIPKQELEEIIYQNTRKIFPKIFI